jgi:hypothetical protein
LLWLELVVVPLMHVQGAHDVQHQHHHQQQQQQQQHGRGSQAVRDEEGPSHHDNPAQN